MRTTLNIDDDLLEKAASLSGVVEKTSLVRLGLEALIARESARRLANLAVQRRDSRTFAGRGDSSVTLVDTSVWVHLHLLASASLSKATLWTADRALMKAAEQLGFVC